MFAACGNGQSAAIEAEPAPSDLARSTVTAGLTCSSIHAVLDGLEPQPRERFAREARHLDRVGQDEAPAVRAHEQRPRAGLAAGVDPIGRPAGQPGEVALGGDQHAAHVVLPGETDEAVCFGVGFSRHESNGSAYKGPEGQL